MQVWKKCTSTKFHFLLGARNLSSWRDDKPVFRSGTLKQRSSCWNATLYKSIGLVRGTNLSASRASIVESIPPENSTATLQWSHTCVQSLHTPGCLLTLHATASLSLAERMSTLAAMEGTHRRSSKSYLSWYISSFDSSGSWPSQILLLHPSPSS